MLIKPLKNISVFAALVILFGCSGSRATRPAIVAAQTTPETSTAVEPKIAAEDQTQVMKSNQKNVPKYLPCVQGPETLRLVDRMIHEAKADRDIAQHYLDMMPPLIRQRTMVKIKKCLSEFEAMNADELTCDIGTANIEIAEELISDCSDQLARLSVLSTELDSREIEAVVRLWQSNLEFMKWWLDNYHQKYGSYKTSH